MCCRLNQFASIPALSFAGKELRIERRRKKKEEDKKADVQVINNICPTDYADVLTVDGGEIGIERMRFGLVPGWAKGTKAEVGKKFGHNPFFQKDRDTIEKRSGRWLKELARQNQTAGFNLNAWIPAWEAGSTGSQIAGRN